MESKSSKAMGSIEDWERPIVSHIAHFDLFSGAAGDMMLAACLDAGQALFPGKCLLDTCVRRLKAGIPSIADEFRVEYERVHRGKGSIAALHVKVHSIYDHRAAPVPKEHNGSHSHEHIHSDHGHEHHHEHHGSHHRQQHDHHDHIQSSSIQDSSLRAHEHTHNHNKHNNNTKEEPLVGQQTTPPTRQRHKNPLRNFPEIRDMIQNAPDECIPPWVKQTGIATFHALATAEAHVHGVSSIDYVHFHEVGAVDSIADTLLTLLALYELNVTSVTFSPLPLGHGTVHTEHGLLPVPAPAALYLMRHRTVVAGPPGWTGELVTPTAAALICALEEEEEDDDDTITSRQQRPPPRFTLRAVGIGAGTKDFANHPNILRLLIGESCTQSADATAAVC